MKTILIVCLTAALIKTGQSLTCLQCHETPYDNCNDLKKSHQCADAVYCVKDIQYYRNGNQKMINRNCLTYSDMIKNKWTVEMIESVHPLKVPIEGGEVEVHLCKTNYCNGSSTATFTILPFVLIFSQYYF